MLICSVLQLLIQLADSDCLGREDNSLPARDQPRIENSLVFYSQIPFRSLNLHKLSLFCCLLQMIMVAHIDHGANGGKCWRHRAQTSEPEWRICLPREAGSDRIFARWFGISLPFSNMRVLAGSENWSEQQDLFFAKWFSSGCGCLSVSTRRSSNICL